MRFFTSDLHFGHVNILRYESRPYRHVDEMNGDLVDRWNARVGPGDEVWVVGDLAMGRLDESLRHVGELHGRIVLVPGNHDRPAPYHRRAEGARARYLASGIDDIVDGPTVVEVAGRSLLVDHFPYVGDSQGSDRYVEQRPTDEGLWLLHGHVHGRWRQRGRMINVGVDAWGGWPVPETRVAELLDLPPQELEPLPWLPA